MAENAPTPDEVAAMLNGLKSEEARPAPSQLEIACGGQLMLVQTPATIHLKDADLPAFIVDDIQGWGYTPFGILAVGYFENENPEDWVTKLFAADVVHDIEFNKARYEEIINEIRAEEEDESGSDSSDDAGTGDGASDEKDWADEATVAA
jgi:hypothetical protein